MFVIRANRLAGAALAVALAFGATAAEADRTGIANLEAGRKALERNALVEAIVEFERAIVADPRNPDGYVYLGQAHQEFGAPRRALKYYQLALELDPGHRRALMMRGRALLVRGALAPAEQTLAVLAAKCNADCNEFERLNSEVRAFKAKTTQ
jgi:tetratricopeptide (TPR) repeat protein